LFDGDEGEEEQEEEGCAHDGWLERAGGMAFRR
jgi:hypothetical protein